MLRKLKLTYSLYNLVNKEALEHNVKFYEKLDLGKQYFSPVSSADFKDVDPSKLPAPTVNPDVTQTRLYNELDEEGKSSTRQFEHQGYTLLKGFLSSETADRVNEELDRMVNSGELELEYNNKLMFAIRKSPFLAGLWKNEKLLEYLNCLIRGRAHLFQSINFLHGSQQRTHSDSIHMTTFPLGGLLGVWVALEDIGPDAGPLHYYPGSHKLPYFLNGDYDNEGTWLTIGKQNYAEYEEMIARKLEASPYDKEVFLARKGDLFIWHANLLHGGEPHRNRELTRKSMVLHYFDSARVCYHEISQRPALFR